MMAAFISRILKMKGEIEMYIIYEVFSDGKKFFRFKSDDPFECEIYMEHHKYDNRIGSLVIERTTDKL